MQAQQSPQIVFKTPDDDQWWSKHVVYSVILYRFKRFTVYM
jgi:hypothetical protein